MVLEEHRIQLYPELIPEVVEEQEQEGEYTIPPQLVEEEVERIYQEAREKAKQTTETMLEEAYAKHDKIVNAAKVDAEHIKEEAQKKGYEQGIVDAGDSLKQQLAQISEGVNAFLDTYNKEVEDLQAKVIELAFAMTEKILSKRISENEAEMREMVHEVIRSVKEKKQIHLQISNQMMGFIDQLDHELEPMRERYQSTIKVKAVPMEAGTCRVETEDGIIDASVFVQLENLRTQLIELSDGA